MAARVLIVLCLVAAAFADSPLTSIDLQSGYETDPLVSQARTLPVRDFSQRLLALNDYGHVAAVVSSVG